MNAVPACRLTSAAVAELQREHGLLLRYLGQVQQRLSDRLYRLENENLRLRAALVVQRTAWLWGLGPPARSDGPAGVTSSDSPSSAHRVLCQVGCEGHAHAWLTDDGQCRRTGGVCDAMAMRETRPTP